MLTLLRASLFSFILISAGHAEVDVWVTTQSYYYPQKGDTLSLVKERLLYKAFDSAIKKALEKRGKDGNKLFENFQNKFDKVTKDDIENYQKKIGYKDDLSKYQKKEIDLKVNRYKFKKRKKFEDFYRLVKSHKVEKRWRDSKNPKVQIMRVKVNISLPDLMRTYANYTIQDNSEALPQEKILYVNLNYQLENFSWDDLNFSDEEDFQNSLIQAWIRWIDRDFKQKNLKVLVRPYTPVLSPELRVGDTKLNLHVKIKKHILEKDFKKYEFNFLVDFSVFSQSDELIYEGKSQTKTQDFMGVGPDRLPNLLANFIYRIPLNDFVHIASNLSKSRLRDQKDQLIVKDFKNHKKVNELMKLLNSYGAELNLRSQITTITSSEITLDLSYKGTQDKLINIIKYISENGFPLSFKSKEFPLTISL